MTKTIHVVTFYEADDAEGDAACVGMYIDNELVIEGDEYHNKVDEQIEGFIMAWEYGEIDHKILYHQMWDHEECCAEDNLREVFTLKEINSGKQIQRSYFGP